MKDKKETAPEVLVQEQVGNKYPTKIELVYPIISLDSFNNDRLISSDKAIKIIVEIDSSLYAKKDIEREIKLACQKLLEYFH